MPQHATDFVQSKDLPLVAVAVAVLRGDRVLALRRAATKDAGAGLWETVSGRIEPGEEPADAARREVREETGLTVELDEIPVDAYAGMRGEHPMVVIFYRARWLSGEVRLSGEHDAHRWWLPDELARHTSLARLVTAVRRAFATEMRK